VKPEDFKPIGWSEVRGTAYQFYGERMGVRKPKKNNQTRNWKLSIDPFLH